MREQDLDLAAWDSLPVSWSSRWASDGARDLLIDSKGRRVTAAQLEEQTRRVAGRYWRAGLEPGDRVLVRLANSLHLVVAHVAALRLGLVVVPTSTSYTERELRQVVDDTTPKLAIVDDAAAARLLADRGRCLVTGPDVGIRDGEAPRLDAARAEDPALICQTSGTTGSPKGAVLSHGNLVAGAEALRLAWRWSADDRLVICLPMFHVHGLVVGLYGSLYAGGSAVVLPRFDAEATIEAASVLRASLLFGVPTMYGRLVRSPRVGELGRLRLCVSGSAPMPPHLARELRERCGQEALERYGMTETMINASNPCDAERRPGRVGFPVPGVEIRIGDGHGDGQAGELLVRGPNVCAGYWQRNEATAAALNEDGWLRTGDIGYRDDDGYLAIAGRAKELIITGGYNVYPREIEDLLRAHPSVADAAVVGVPSDEWGEEVVAFVVAHERSDPAKLLAFISADLAPYKRPRRVHMVDAIPRNALGKVMREELSGR